MDGIQLLDRIRPHEHRLANGLTLLVRENHSWPVVAIVTHVRAGYFDEPDRLVGISHVLEHMYFKGTDRRDVGEIARATKSAGGYLNAGTIYDHTSYYAVLPSSALETGLDLQADALIHSRIDEEELRKELLVIIQEVKRKLDDPGAMAAEKLYEAMFDVHPMRRWRMGTEEGLRAMTRGDVLGYYREMYRAANITLVVSGDVDTARVVERVERLYADVPPGEPTRPERSEPGRAGARFREMSGDIGHTYVELGWRTPGALHPDTPTLDVLAVALGQGRASRLYRGVREAGLVSSIRAHNYTPLEIGVFGVSLECEPADTESALRATWSELERVRASNVDPDELDRVRTLVEVRLLRRLETVEGQANLLAEWQALGDWREAGAYLDRVRAVGPAEIRAVAERHLAPDALTLLAYRPRPAPALGWQDADLPDALEGGGAPARAPAPELQPVASSVRAPVAIGRSHTEDGVTRFPLDGAMLVVKPRSHSPLVSIAVFGRGGPLNESLENAGITGLMMRSTHKGTATRTAQRIALDAERLGGSMSAAVGPDLLSWSLTVPADHLRPALDLLADVALRPSFPAAEVERERNVLLADLDSVRDDMYRYPLRLLMRAAFGDHPYGHGPNQIEPSLHRLSAGDLRRWHGRHVAEPWIFVVGDVEPGAVAEAVAGRFGSVARPLGDDGPPPAWPDSPRVESVRRDRAQTARAIGFPGPPRNHEDEPALRVLGSAVSGLGNRLFEELRGRRSLAYTVTAYPLARRWGGAFVGYIATSPDRAEEARSALVRELLSLRDEPPTERELERARRYMVGAWRIRTQTNAAQLSELARAMLIGRGLRDLTEFEDRIRAVDRDHALGAARRWFDESRMVEGVVHGGGD